MLNPGDSAPPISGTDILGSGAFSLAAHAGEVVCLAFVSVTCIHCANEMPRLQHLWDKYRGHGVQMVAVHANPNMAGAITWLNGMGITFPVIQDDAAFSMFNSYATGTNFVPQLYIIDRGQIIHYANVGEETEPAIDGHILDAIYSRDPVDIELVMDVSDTMNDVPAGGDTKLTMMKQASKMVVDFLHDHGQTGDRAGLVWFTDNASEYADAGGHKLLPPISSSTELDDQIDTHGTGICTAMGAGLQTALNTLSSSANDRFTILLTDGMQNIDPKVMKVGGHYEIIDDTSAGAWHCGGHSTTAAHPGVDIATYNTRIHTIGVGVAGTYSILLEDIANSLGGIYLGTNDPATDLDLIYFVDLCNCLAHGSPAIVHHHSGSFLPRECQAIESFSINRTARKITAILSWNKSLNGSLAFWLRAPDGTLLDLHGDTKMYGAYTMATVYLPKEQGGRKLPAVGDWKMIVRGEADGQAAYHAMIIAEDRETGIVLDYPRKEYAVGDIVPFRVRLKNEKQGPIKPADVILEKTTLRVPVAELLAQFRITPIQLKEEMQAGNRLSPLELKLRALSCDPRFQEQVKPVKKLYSLKEGTLDCKISEKELILPVPVKEPGLNTFRIEVRFSTEENGPVSRVTMASVHVSPGKADPEKTSVHVIPVSMAKSKGALMDIVPKNAYGQLLGPGLAEEFSVSLGDEKAKYKVEDMLDGAYRIELSTDPGPTTRRRQARLKLGEKALWEGALE